MKFLAISAFCLAGLWAQTTPSPAAKAPTLPDIPNDKVVVGFDDGSSMTMGELRWLLSNASPAQRQQALSNMQAYLDQLALLHKLVKLAEDQKLDQKSPVKERLAYERANVLWQAEVNEQENSGSVEEGELEKYYENHKAKYRQVRTDAIYIAFSNAPASQTAGDKKILSADEAKAKAEKLRDEIRNGADFKKLARENSDDETSRAKDGYFGVLNPADNIPDSIKAAIFNLKPGETSDVISQPNGYYLFRAEEVTYKPFKDVRDQIYTEYRQERLRAWLDRLRDETKAHVLDPKLTGSH
jgi:parvulin-like peptidyl-prolyl isomerase